MSNLRLEATVTVNNAGAVKPLEDVATAAEGLGDALQGAAADARAASDGVGKAIDKTKVTKPLEDAARAAEGLGDALQGAAADAQAAGAEIGKSVGGAGLTKPLEAGKRATNDLAAALERAANEARQSGASISHAVNDVARQTGEASRRQIADAQAAAFGKRGVERKAALERIEELRRVGREERAEAERTARAVIQEARRKAAAENQAAQAIRKAQNMNRIGTAQLGMQLNDITTQAAAGTQPMIIFAQQANQVGYAMSMMGGTASRVGSILMGPWGAAMTMAAMGLSILVGALRDGRGATDELTEAAKRQKEALEELARMHQQQSQDERGRINALLAEAEARRTNTIEVRRELAAKLELAQANLAAQQRTTGADGSGGAAAAGVAPLATLAVMSSLEKQIAANAKAMADAEKAISGGRFAQAQLDAKDATDAAAAAMSRYRAESARLQRELTAGKITQQQATAGLIAAEHELKRAQEAAANAKKGASAAGRDAARAEREAARQAKRDLEEQIKLTNELMKARFAWLNSVPTIAAVWEQQDKAEEARLRARDNDQLSKAVKSIDEDRDIARATDRMGRDIAAEAARELEMRAIDIGGLLGGHAGAALGAVVAGMRSGDFRSLGGPLGGALQGVSNAYQERDSRFRDAMKPMVDSFNQVFGGRPFAQTLGSAFQGAGVGSQLGSLFGGSRSAQMGATLGGAMGQVAGEVVGKTIGKTLGAAAGPLGAIAGSLLGGALGGLFGGSKPKGSVTLTGVGGDVNVGAATGTGGSQKSNSTRAANSISSALSQIADQLGADIGSFSVSIGMSGGKYRVDTSGLGRTNKKNAGVTGYGEDAAAAVQAALADAIADGAITGVSPRVQSALRKYADDIDRALAEAMKVQGLEDLLADRQNPFTSVFRDFERQARERLKIAERYGFDVLEIEALNAEQRKKLLEDQLASVAQSARSLLDDLRFGSRAEGSIVDRLAAMGGERARLQSLVDGGDSSQIDALTRIIEQQLDLTREAYGSTSPFAEERSASMTALDAIIRQTEARINEASAAAQAQQNTNAQLAEANTTLDEQTVLLQQIRDNLAKMGSGAGGITFDPSSFSWTHLL